MNSKTVLRLYICPHWQWYGWSSSDGWTFLTAFSYWNENYVSFSYAVKSSSFNPRSRFCCDKSRKQTEGNDTATFALVYFASGRAFLFSSMCTRYAFVMVNKKIDKTFSIIKTHVSSTSCFTKAFVLRVLFRITFKNSVQQIRKIVLTLVSV